MTGEIKLVLTDDTGSRSDFYRLGQSPGPASSPPTSMISGSVGEAETEAEKIDKLMEENKQLTAMVQEFAAELEVIKKKIGGSA
ncbi:hypothetical protein LTS12_027319 [Elasticomyces elasticus]|nr:hypothetical protein LTS12_027319 [Elasticomyces elasticus]